MNKKYYLSYGSNLNIAQMAFRCPNARAVGIATLHDWRLIFRGSKTGAYLTIEPCLGAEVPVAVWRITAADERMLDRYEGFPTFYYKKTMPVLMTSIQNGMWQKTVDAMVYIMHEDRPIGVPSETYLQTCGEGYLDFNFDMETLEDALSYSKAMVGRKEVT